MQTIQLGETIHEREQQVAIKKNTLKTSNN